MFDNLLGTQNIRIWAVSKRKYFQYFQLFVVSASRYTIVEFIGKPSLKKCLGVLYFQPEHHYKVFGKFYKNYPKC